MIARTLLLILLALAVAGCASRRDRNKPAAAAAAAPAPAPAPQQSASSGRSWTKPLDYNAGGPVPAMESGRAINEQDCTQGINLTAGNLRCR